MVVKCEREIVIVFVYFLKSFFVLIFFEQFQVRKHVHNSFKTRKLSYFFEKFEENMDLSHIHLAVIVWDNMDSISL